jgi:hypothetical protein
MMRAETEKWERKPHYKGAGVTGQENEMRAKTQIYRFGCMTTRIFIFGYAPPTISYKDAA